MIVAGEVVGLDAWLEIWSQDGSGGLRSRRSLILGESGLFPQPLQRIGLLPLCPHPRDPIPRTHTEMISRSFLSAWVRPRNLHRCCLAEATLTRLARHCSGGRSLTARPVAQAPGRGIRDGVSIGKIPRLFDGSVNSR